jgi:hypothetical protein
MAVAFHLRSCQNCSSARQTLRPSATPTTHQIFHQVARLQGRLQHRGQHVCRLAAVRQPKDPSSFKSMDELRDYLERGEGGGANNGFISGKTGPSFASGWGFAGSGIDACAQLCQQLCDVILCLCNTLQVSSTLCQTHPLAGQAAGAARWDTSGITHTRVLNMHITCNTCIPWRSDQHRFGNGHSRRFPWALLMHVPVTAHRPRCTS